MYFSNFSPPPPIGRMNIQFLIDATGTNTSGSTPMPYELINSQTGTSYAIDTSDLNKLVTFSNASPVAVSLSDPTIPPPGQNTNGNFDAGWQCDVINLGAGLVTITTASTLIGGSATLQLAQYQGAKIVSDGANWQIFGLNITNLAAGGPGGVSGILQIANGGTGTASPGLTAGTGISITGTWPNNTITSTVSVNFADNETPSGSINGSNTSFTLAHTPSPAGSLRLYVNGILQVQGTDYTISTATITMTNAPTTGANMLAYYRY